MKYKKKKKIFLDVPNFVTFQPACEIYYFQGGLERIKRLFRQMVENQVTPTLQSYAACLECLGREDPVNVDTVQRILEDIDAAVSKL